MKREAIQTTLFPETASPVKRDLSPDQAEYGFMIEVMKYASSICLPNIHVENYCGNKFFVECPYCGHKTLARCRKTINKALTGFPDVLGIFWGVEVKRNGFEPSPLQLSTHERLKRQGVPVFVTSPGNLSAAIAFLKDMKLQKQI